MSKVITDEQELNTSTEELVTENYALEILGLKNVADFRKFSRSFMKLDEIVKGIEDGKANKNHKHDDTEIISLDASKLKGTIDISRLPQAALERCVVVADDTARFKLTKSQVQVGDSVKVTSPDNLMYIVVDDTKLNSEEGYIAYSAAVKWDTIKDKPSVFPPASHNQDGNTINKLTGYVKAAAIAGILPTDSLIVALGKLEKALDGKAQLSHSHKKSEISDFSHTHNKKDILDFPAFGTNSNQILEGVKLAETLGIPYGGGLNNSNTKTAGYAYYDSTTKKTYKCTVTNTLNYADASKFEAISNADLLAKFQNFNILQKKKSIIINKNNLKNYIIQFGENIKQKYTLMQILAYENEDKKFYISQLIPIDTLISEEETFLLGYFSLEFYGIFSKNFDTCKITYCGSTETIKEIIFY